MGMRPNYVDKESLLASFLHQNKEDYSPKIMAHSKVLFASKQHEQEGAPLMLVVIKLNACLHEGL